MGGEQLPVNDSALTPYKAEQHPGQEEDQPTCSTFDLVVTREMLKVLLIRVSLPNSLMKQKFAFEISQYLREWLYFKLVTSFYCPSLLVSIPSLKSSFTAMDYLESLHGMPWENARGHCTGPEWRKQESIDRAGGVDFTNFIVTGIRDTLAPGLGSSVAPLSTK